MLICGTQSYNLYTAPNISSFPVFNIIIIIEVHFVDLVNIGLEIKILLIRVYFIFENENRKLYNPHINTNFFFLKMHINTISC